MLARPFWARFVAVMLLAAGALAPSACAHDGLVSPDRFGYGLVRISPVLLSYGAGSDVQLEIENVGPSVLATGQCPSALERQNGTSWEVVQTFDSLCNELRFRIEPGVIGPGILALPGTLSTGLYRARYDKITAVNESVSVNTFQPIGARYSETFSVTAASSR